MTLLIVGLGNPGPEYSATRHNLGFLMLDELVTSLDTVPVKTKALAKAWTADRDGVALYLLKPETFMNLSGNAVAPFMRTKKLAAKDLVVTHDDLDLPFGEIRVSRGASSGGHNGVQSVIDSLGTKDFTRVRIGIGRPPEGSAIDDYVLERWSRDEWEKLPGIIKEARKEIEKLFSR